MAGDQGGVEREICEVGGTFRRWKGGEKWRNIRRKRETVGGK